MPIKELQFPNPEDVFSPIFTKLWECDSRFLINYGGTGSSKSYSAAQKEVLKTASEVGITTAVFRKVGSTLKKSVYKSFKSRIREFDLWDIFTENKTEMTLTCTQTGSQIWFLGLDDPEKLKSIEGVNRIMIEEASELDIDDLLELNRRVRGVPDIQITINFNPVHEFHWLKKHFFDDPLPNATIIHSTYHDNKWLSEEDRAEIERLHKFNYNQYRIYALGDWGISENGNPWLYSFDEERHIADVSFMPTYPVYLSFDFNRDPATCTAWQMSPNAPLNVRDSWVHCIAEFAEPVQLKELCERIKGKFPHSMFFVTGDRTGKSGNVGFETRNTNMYSLIESYLRISPGQVQCEGMNLRHNDSRQLCNAVLYNHVNFKISRTCKKLISECHMATVDEKKTEAGVLLKDRAQYKMDLFDGLRYYLQTYFEDFSTRVRAGK